MWLLEETGLVMGEREGEREGGVVELVGSSKTSVHPSKIESEPSRSGKKKQDRESVKNKNEGREMKCGFFEKWKKREDLIWKNKESCFSLHQLGGPRWWVPNARILPVKGIFPHQICGLREESSTDQTHCVFWVSHVYYLTVITENKGVPEQKAATQKTLTLSRQNTSAPYPLKSPKSSTD